MKLSYMGHNKHLTSSWHHHKNILVVWSVNDGFSLSGRAMLSHCRGGGQKGIPQNAAHT